MMVAEEKSIGHCSSPGTEFGGSAKQGSRDSAEGKGAAFSSPHQ